MSQKLKIVKLKLTTISFYLTNELVRHPRGMVENVPAKIDKYYFPHKFYCFKHGGGLKDTTHIWSSSFNYI